MQMLKRKSGITLVALIITIIILLILAGVSLSFVFNGGILDKSQQAVNEYQNASQKEQDLLDQIDKYIENELGEMNTDDNVEQIEGNITDLVKPGDYVEYNPTVIDKNGTPVDSDKLTYTSPIGTIPTSEGEMITHGNGNSSQTFTANNTTRWRVLDADKSSGKVELISEYPIQTDEGKNFILEGGIGYLYASEELSRICSIYGYGYGADTSMEISYSVGGPEDELITGKIQNTGARSITIEDINKKENLSEDDILNLEPNYNRTDILTDEVYYPSLKSTNTVFAGQSNNIALNDKIKDFYKHIHYYYSTKIENIELKNMLFNGYYWLNSYWTDTHSKIVYIGLRRVEGTAVGGGRLCNATSSNLYPNTNSDNCIRPVVSLKANIQVINDKNSEHTWILK